MPRRLWYVPGLLLSALLCIGAEGCGAGAPNTATAVKPAAPAAPPAAGAAAEGKPGGEAAGSAARRKIIFTGTVDVVVGDLDAARVEVDKLIARYEAYVAKSEVRSDTGVRRSAVYTIRVPVDSFRQLVDGLLALGTPERNATDSQDVTEEYIDVEARIKNLKAEEEVLNKLLKESGSRDDVLKTREQIRAIRGDIERAQARLDYLSKLSALSTVNLTLQEIKNYQPPTAPTFSSRVRQTFEGSWDSFVGFTEWVALLAVALTPWLPVLIPVGVGGFWLVRKWWRVVTRPDPVPYRRTPVARPANIPVNPEPRPTEGAETPAPADPPKTD